MADLNGSLLTMPLWWCIIVPMPMGGLVVRRRQWYRIVDTIVTTDRVTTMAISDGGQVVLLVGGGGRVVAEMQGNGDTTYSCAVENIAKLAQFSRLSGVGQTQHFCTRFGYI